MPLPLNEHVRSQMESQRTSGTEPELAVRRALHRRGFRYRVNFQPTQTVRTKADIVFTKHKIAVFIDGCFWHGCPEHFIPPKNNAGWWAEKIGANVDRDRRVRDALAVGGWKVERFWEHQVPSEVAETIIATIRQATN